MRFAPISQPMIDDPRDELARQRAELDQALAELPDAAHTAFLLFDSYTRQGFTREEALQLLIASIEACR